MVSQPPQQLLCPDILFFFFKMKICITQGSLKLTLAWLIPRPPLLGAGMTSMYPHAQLLPSRPFPHHQTKTLFGTSVSAIVIYLPE